MQTKQNEIDAYKFEIQIMIGKGNKLINMRYLHDWTLDDVEKFTVDFFNKMKITYYKIGTKGA